MSYTGKRPTFNTAALTPQSTAPANPVTGDMYLNDGTGSLKIGLYRYNGSAFVHIQDVLTPVATAPSSNLLTGQLYINDGSTTSIEGGLYRYNGSQFVRTDAREKNLIINGGFDFWQRGTTFSSISGAYTADRWRFDNNSGAIVTNLTRSTDVPIATSNYSLRVTAGTGGGLSTPTLVNLKHFIEGFNIRELDGSPFTLSFWVRSTVTGQHSLSFANNATDRFFATSYTVNTTNTWEKKYVRVPAVDVSVGAWNITTAKGLVVNFGIANGTDRLIAASTVWANGGPYDGATGAVNAMATTGNIWAVSDVMLTKGEDRKANFQRAGHSITEELALCQRYYQKSYDLGTDPGTATTTGRVNPFNIASGETSSTYTMKTCAKLVTIMRTAPTVTSYDPSVGTSGNARVDSGSVTATVSLIGDTGFELAATNGGATSARILNFHYVADAEL